jgi:PAS domain S-box-containing protein
MTSANRGADCKGKQLSSIIKEKPVANDPARASRVPSRGKESAAQARDRWASLYEMAPVAYLTLDGKGVIEDINLPGCTLLRGERAEFIGRSFAELVAPEDAAHWRDYLKRARQSKQPQSCELALRLDDGRKLPASLAGRSVEIAGRKVLCLVIGDISEHLRREKEALDWRKEMAELRKIQIAAQTATAIAHELNQPLLAIASYSEAAVKLLAAGSPDLHKINRAVQGCQRQAHRAGETIHELLDYLSLKEIAAEAIDLNRIIGDVVEAARSEHELQFDSVLLLEEGLPPVLANRIHVEKVIFNLLRNGIEAMHESAVPLPAITVTVRTRCDANTAQVTIQDNGPGVKEENLQQLFRPFFTTKAKGIGMGLAVSRSLIEANGGQLWIDPAEGPGAIFHLTLPFAP